MDITDYDDNIDYISTRLSGSLCKLKSNGEPILIQEIFISHDEDDSGEVVVHADKFVNGVEYGITLCLEDIDINPFPIGNVNAFNNCCFVERLCSRQWKQGFWSHNIHTDMFLHISSPPLINAVKGMYPSIHNGFELLMSGESTHVGISRELSIQDPSKNTEQSAYESTLFYRSKLPIGSMLYRPEDGFTSVTLFNSFDYLNEYVYEQLRMS